MKTYSIEKCAKTLSECLAVVAKFKAAGQPCGYWDRCVDKWSHRLIQAAEHESFSKGELRALFDAANNMSDDFRDYFSFMGKKRLEAHANNYSSAMEKLRLLIK